MRLVREFPGITVLSRKERIKQLCEGVSVVVLNDGDVFMSVLNLVSIPGHTDDSAAVLDMRTNTMITGDSLQVYGIFGSEEWGSNINLTFEYLYAIKKLRKMDIDNIYSAHDYHPYGFKAEGREAVRKFIDGREEPIIKYSTSLPIISRLMMRLYTTFIKIPQKFHRSRFVLLPVQENH